MPTSEILGIVATVITVTVALGKWLLVAPLKNFIREQTYPIQPTSNGGRSLPDVAHAIARIEDRLNEHIDFHLKDK